MAYISASFNLDENFKKNLHGLKPEFGFNGFGEAVFYRTYSRKKSDGCSESWNDVVIRVTEGIFEIRKDYMLKHRLKWNDQEWQNYAQRFAESMFKMHFLPPGRGLWACGTDFVKTRGSAALNNCGTASLKDLVQGVTWGMDMLMNGVGVGFDVAWNEKMKYPNKDAFLIYEIPDSREGWVESVSKLIRSYLGEVSFPKFDYSLIRPLGSPIKGFGGTASGPEPLIKLHRRLEVYLDTYCLYCESRNPRGSKYSLDYWNTVIFGSLIDKLRPIEYPEMTDEEFGKLREDVISASILHFEEKQYNSVRLCVDICNSCACCIVAGNVRRSSEIIIGPPNDLVFLNLKNYRINPERSTIGWMSNNSVRMETREDFAQIPEIANRIRDNGEPGVLNRLNMNRFGRVGRYHSSADPWNREFEPDLADLTNPCVTVDTLILTAQGWQSVSDLIGRSFVAVVDGKEYLSTEKGFWHTGRKLVYELELENGLELKATGNHVIFTAQGEIELSKLTHTNEVIVPNNTGYKWADELYVTTQESAEIGQMRLLRHGTNAKRNRTELSYYMLNENPQGVNYCSRVLKITSLSEENVYDCTIPGINAFNANGMKVHNCGEIGLEPFELCNLAEVFPPRCINSSQEKSKHGSISSAAEKSFLEAIEFATFYTSTVSLLPTHWENTNAIIARNRRIGVSLSGIADVYEILGCTELTRLCRLGYRKVREINSKLAKEAGVPESIRVTTVKPSGTISQLVGVSSGMHFPTFKYAIRRMRLSTTDPVLDVLKKANYKWEKDTYSDNTEIVEFPIDQGKTRPATEVSMWEQFSLLTMLTREWADNMVSCTIYFDPEREGNQIELALAQHIPSIKSCSMLPHTKEGVYRQAPYESISREKYQDLLKGINQINWEKFRGQEAEIPKYCQGDICILEAPKRRGEDEPLQSKTKRRRSERK